jgi:hypothetical protein
MANTVIQLRFSEANSAPTLLNVAEPAYSYVSNTLFIGTANSDGAIIVGGKAYIDKINSAYEYANTVGNTVNTSFGTINGGSF